VWAAEVFLVQECIYQPDVDLEVSRLAKRMAVRFALDLMSCAVVVLLCPRWLLIVLFVTVAFGSLVEVVHFNYFSAPLSFVTVVHQAGEGAAVADAFFAQLPPGVAAALLAALVVKTCLVCVSARLPRAARMRIGLAFSAGLVAALIVLLVAYRPIELGWRSRSFWGGLYGTVIVGAHELAYYDATRIEAAASDGARVTSDLLRDRVEMPLDVAHISIVQVESLDWDVVRATVGGKRVMPFLSRVSGNGLACVIEAVHPTGSADSDFTMLMGHMPNAIVPPYSVTGFDYGSALPEFAEELGWIAYAYHGNRGTFFERRRAFSQMGFADIAFEEEMLAAGVVGGEWGVDDGPALQYASRRSRGFTDPHLNFIITLTTHSPWRFVPEGVEQVVESAASGAGMYFNNMHYVDCCLRDYYTELPDRSVLIIYGDHDSREVYREKSEAGRRGERVPFVVVQKGVQYPAPPAPELAELPLSTLDAAAFVRRLVAQNRK
jgi:hypothetical protein